MAFKFKSVDEMIQGQQAQAPQQQQQGQPGAPEQQMPAPQPVAKPIQQPQDFTKSKGSANEALLLRNQGDVATGAIASQTKQKAQTQADKITSSNQEKANQYVQTENQKLGTQQQQIRNANEGVRDLQEGRETGDTYNSLANALGTQYQAGDLALDQGDVDHSASGDIGSYLQREKAKDGYTAGMANLDSALFNSQGGAKADLINMLNKRSMDIEGRRQQLSKLPEEQQARGNQELDAMKGDLKNALKQVKQKNRDRDTQSAQGLKKQALDERAKTIQRLQSSLGGVGANANDPSIQNSRQRLNELKAMTDDQYLNSVGVTGSDDDVRTSESANRLNRISQLLGEQANYKTGNAGNVEKNIYGDYNNQGKLDQSVSQYQIAEALKNKDPRTHYKVQGAKKWFT